MNIFVLNPIGFRKFRRSSEMQNDASWGVNVISYQPKCGAQMSDKYDTFPVWGQYRFFSNSQIYSFLHTFHISNCKNVDVTFYFPVTYYCAKGLGSVFAYNCRYGDVDTASSLMYETLMLEEDGKIESTLQLRNTSVFLYTGGQDSKVVKGEMQQYIHTQYIHTQYIHTQYIHTQYRKTGVQHLAHMGYVIATIDTVLFGFTHCV